jgi:hypothetical protein
LSFAGACRGTGEVVDQTTFVARSFVAAWMANRHGHDHDETSAPVSANAGYRHPWWSIAAQHARSSPGRCGGHSVPT